MAIEAKKQFRGNWLTVESHHRGSPHISHSNDSSPSPLSISSPTRSPFTRQRSPRYLSVSRCASSDCPSDDLSSSFTFHLSPSEFCSDSNDSVMSSSAPVSPCHSAKSTSDIVSVSPLILPHSEGGWAVPLPALTLIPALPLPQREVTEEASDQVHSLTGWRGLSLTVPFSHTTSPSPSFLLEDSSLTFGSTQPSIPSPISEEDDPFSSLSEEDSPPLPPLSPDALPAKEVCQARVVVDSLSEWPQSIADREEPALVLPLKSTFSNLSLSSLHSPRPQHHNPFPTKAEAIELPATSTFISAFFSPCNAAWAELLDEAAFRQEYETIHGHTPEATMDVAWQLVMGGVMAVGARIKGEIHSGYSRHAASLASEASTYIGNVTDPANPGFAAQLLSALGASRLALAYRGLVLFAHYKAAMCGGFTDLLRTASHLLSCPAVSALVPVEVQLMASMLPVLDEATARPHSYGSGEMEESQVKASTPLLAQIQRDVDTSRAVSRAEVLTVAGHLTQATSTADLSHVRLSVPQYLAVLSRAEASPLCSPHREEVLGLKAACYQLMGQPALAVQAAQETIGLFTSSLSLSLPLCLSSVGFAFMRALLILCELDVSVTSTSLICRAMTMAGDAARTWPRLTAVHCEWQRTLEVWSGRQVDGQERPSQPTDRFLLQHEQRHEANQRHAIIIDLRHHTPWGRHLDRQTK